MQKILESASNIEEQTIAEAVIKSYDGELCDYNCCVTTDTYTEDSDQSVVFTTVAFVEIQDDEDRQNQFECESCDSNKGSCREWDFRVRNEEGWVYHDWCCPVCKSIVNTDLVETPESQNRVHVSG